MAGYYKVTYPDGTTSDGQIRPEDQWVGFGLPKSVETLKVYDYGTWDGGLAIEAFRRGAAEVWGLDCFVWEMWSETRRNFERNVAQCAPTIKNAWVESEPVPGRRLNATSVIKSEKMTIQEFASKQGPADLVIAAGVLYHLKNPYKFIEDIRLLVAAHGLLFLTTWCLNDTPASIMRFSYGWRDDDTNYWVASPQCVIDMTKAAGMRVIAHYVVAPGLKNSPEPLVMFVAEHSERHSRTSPSATAGL